MLETLIGRYHEARENHAFGLLLRPRVLANWRRHQQELHDRPLVMSTSPTTVEIELTNRCNLACVQCLRSRGLKPYELGSMSFENYQRIL
jgi:hypothetical protein